MTRTIFVAVVMLPAVLAALVAVPRGRPPAPVIARHDPAFDRLIPPDATVEVVASAHGLAWVEGPVWAASRGALLFSDIPNNRIMQWHPARGLSVFLEPSGYTGTMPFTGREPGSNGLALDPAGRLVLAQHGDRRIVRLERDGAFTVLADRYGGKRLNSPNDLVYAADGALYFTDPPFGLPRTFSDPGRELDFQGVYRLLPGGQLTLLSAALEAPNGVALSPDERTLYVSNASVTHPTWWKFGIESDGTLGPMRLLYDGTAWTSRWKGSADGLKVDETGHVFAAGPGGVHVFTPDGHLLGSIVTGEATGNCAWGEGGSTLFITGSQSVYRVRTLTRGTRSGRHE